MVWTIGTGNRQLSALLELLKQHQISMVWDVRSNPYSWNPAFHGRSLKKSLPANGIRYWFMGDVLGGREEIPREVFEMAIDEIVMLSRQERICLMCSELKACGTKRLPEGCHRFNLIAPALARRGIQTVHI